MVDIADAFARLGEQGLQPAFAVGQGQVAQVLSLGEQQVEDEIDQVSGVLVRDRRLQGREVGRAVVIQGAYLTVVNSIGQFYPLAAISWNFSVQSRPSRV